ncbi:hypothetical protein BJ165DRAFT_1524347 [Panaeolus papilionaceus]|nr:hypothetical protein BJ165DRAFT_1524347 [Panaeolus papilionaceus]
MSFIPLPVDTPLTYAEFAAIITHGLPQAHQIAETYAPHDLHMPAILTIASNLITLQKRLETTVYDISRDSLELFYHYHQDFDYLFHDMAPAVQQANAPPLGSQQNCIIIIDDEEEIDPNEVEHNNAPSRRASRRRNTCSSPYNTRSRSASHRRPCAEDYF